MGAHYPTFADVSGASALLFLADSSPAPPPPSPPPALRYPLHPLPYVAPPNCMPRAHFLVAINLIDPPLRRASPHCSDEFSCYSGSSSTSSYSSASARSCVSDSARRGRPVDPLRVLSVVASLRRINPKVLAEATSTLFRSGAEKKRKGVWIEIDSYNDDEDQSERSSAVASEGSTVTAASAGSTATSGRCRRPPRSSGGGGEKAPRRADVIMQWFSRPQAGPATENDIRAAVGDNSGTSKAIRWLLKQEGGLRRAGTGRPLDPYVYMVCEIRADY
ncbi:hypothetical protein BAE44_0018514 [Dichanthelium oligosanthes]|uniref:HTH three-helical bundle domain-containing protein n=1 Tax=Dichanthelium oligosanthes TaxID=888268 RepID=A0A1E5V5N1_9POAL|nr:hypothetical protein BAE44_0018514 [Dichanthelium oligosanthes]